MSLALQPHMMLALRSSMAQAFHGMGFTTLHIVSPLRFAPLHTGHKKTQKHSFWVFASKRQTYYINISLSFYCQSSGYSKPTSCSNATASLPSPYSPRSRVPLGGVNSSKDLRSGCVTASAFKGY